MGAGEARHAMAMALAQANAHHQIMISDHHTSRTPAIGDPEHQAFMATIVDAFIRALDERQDQQPSPSRSSLARQAYDKMQFDFPLLSVEELEAFDSEIGSTMASGTFPAQYPLSDKMMSALIDGASVTNTSSRTATRDGNNEGDADEREGAVTTGTPEPSRLQVLLPPATGKLSGGRREGAGEQMEGRLSQHAPASPTPLRRRTARIAAVVGGIEQNLGKALEAIGVDLSQAASSSSAYSPEERSAATLAFSLLASLAGRLGTAS
eukprot:gene3521-4434_t